MAEKQFRVMLRGIPPQELHGVKIALLVIDHTGELRHRLIVGAGVDGVRRQQVIAGFQLHQHSQHPVGMAGAKVHNGNTGAEGNFPHTGGNGYPLQMRLLPVVQIALLVEYAEGAVFLISHHVFQFFLLDIDLGPREEMGTAGVVQMQVGQHHSGDLLRLDSQLCQPFRHAAVFAGNIGIAAQLLRPCALHGLRVAAGIEQHIACRSIQQERVDGDGGVLALVLGNGVVSHHDDFPQIQYIQLHKGPPFEKPLDCLSSPEVCFYFTRASGSSSSFFMSLRKAASGVPSRIR